MTTEAATLPGVEVKTAINPRDEMIAQLASASRKERDEEIRANGGEVVDTLNVSGPIEPPEEGEEIKPVEAEKPVIEEKPAEVAKPVEAQDDYVTVKVDGQERQVLKSQIIEAGVRTLQKESAADQRLAEATRLLREAKETTNPKPRPLPDMDEIELARRIRQGDDAEAAEAMRVLKGRDLATPDQIAASVEARVMNQIQFKQDAEWFKATYKEIVADPYLARMAFAMDDQFLSNGDTRSDRERYQSIGDELRGKMREWKGGKADVSTSTEKIDRKATITNLPSASVRQAAPEQPKARSTAQIIDDMRKARGQAA